MWKRFVIFRRQSLGLVLWKEVRPTEIQFLRVDEVSELLHVHEAPNYCVLVFRLKLTDVGLNRHL